MEKEEMQALFLSQTANYIWDNGSYLNERLDGIFKIKLYFSDEKYFEIYYLKQNEDRVLKIVEMNLDEILSLYDYKPNWQEEKKILHKK
jgi:hypothetical protein